MFILHSLQSTHMLGGKRSPGSDGLIELLDGFAQGWNFRYITDFTEPLRFYLRGYEFTRQLDHFIDCILKNKNNLISNFKDGHQADHVIDRILADASKNGRAVNG